MFRRRTSTARRSYVDDDPDPLTVHHMIVDIVVGFPTLEILSAEVVMETHPHTSCTAITDHYDNLVGLSIARGFTHKVRELFGGPRGCTHTTALLQAPPLWIVDRLEKLGLDPTTWQGRMRGG